MKTTGKEINANTLEGINATQTKYHTEMTTNPLLGQILIVRRKMTILMRVVVMARMQMSITRRVHISVAAELRDRSVALMVHEEERASSEGHGVHSNPVQNSNCFIPKLPKHSLMETMTEPLV